MIIFTNLKTNEDITLEEYDEDLINKYTTEEYVMSYTNELGDIMPNNPNEGDLERYYEVLALDDHEIACVIACEYIHTDPDDHVVYVADSFEDLAMDFVDEGLMGEVPERLENYIDYKALGNDLSYEYTMVTFNDTTYFVSD